MITALVEIKPDQVVEVPDSVSEVWDEFRDMMLAELPKLLPSKCAIDHRIELEPGNQPPI